MSANEPVILDASPGGVAIVLLNRPEKHNAFNAEIIGKLSDAFETLRGGDELRCVLLRGAGKSFSAGADIEWLRAAAHYDEAENREDALALARMIDKLYRLPCLTIALVNGVAMGGGLGLIAACDVAIAVASAKFRFSEVRLGIMPAVISPYVIEAVGARWARRLFATGELFDAALAKEIGLIHEIAPDEAGLDAAAERFAALAAETAPHAVDETRALVRDVAHRPIDAHILKLTAERIARRRASEEGKEGLAAFLEKRKPSWITGG